MDGDPLSILPRKSWTVLKATASWYLHFRVSVQGRSASAYSYIYCIALPRRKELEGQFCFRYDSWLRVPKIVVDNTAVVCKTPCFLSLFLHLDPHYPPSWVASNLSGMRPTSSVSTLGIASREMNNLEIDLEIGFSQRSGCEEPGPMFLLAGSQVTQPVEKHH